VTTTTLAKQLHERNLLRSTELRSRQTYLVRRTVSSSRVSVLHLAATALDPPTDNRAPTPPTEHPTSQDSATTRTETATGRTGQVASPHTSPGSATKNDTPHQNRETPAPTPARPDPADPR
jgi:hypothetical protein